MHSHIRICLYAYIHTKIMDKIRKKLEIKKCKQKQGQSKGFIDGQELEKRKIIRQGQFQHPKRTLHGPSPCLACRGGYDTSKCSLLGSWVDDLSIVMLSHPLQEPNLALLACLSHLEKGKEKQPHHNHDEESVRTQEGQWWTAEKKAWLWTVLNMKRLITLCGPGQIFFMCESENSC